MQVTIKRHPISTGGPRIAVLTKEDARRLGAHRGNRIKISAGDLNAIAVLDISEDTSFLSNGTILINHEVARLLPRVRTATLSLISKPISLHYIKEKLSGEELSAEKLHTIVSDIANDTLIDYETAMFVAAGYVHGFTHDETVALTRAMVATGDVIDFGNAYDKHCTGGVPNNRTTMLIVPILAAAGLTIPKTSSRSITSPAGTADTMEVLANVELNHAALRRVVAQENGCIIWGGSLNLAPADDKFIRIESPFHIDAEGQLIASVLAKKASVSAKHILIDIPVGTDTKFKTRKEGNAIKRTFLKVAKDLGMNLSVILTDGNEPIGRGIGPVLEARDVLWILEGDARAPHDLEEKSLMMAGELLELSGKAAKGKGYDLARHYLKTRKALDKMKRIIAAQGKRVDTSKHIREARYHYPVRADKKGIHAGYQTNLLSVCARILGAPQDKQAGIYLNMIAGDRIKPGDTIFTLYAENLEKLKAGTLFYEDHMDEMYELKKN